MAESIGSIFSRLKSQELDKYDDISIGNVQQVVMNGVANDRDTESSFGGVIEW